MICLLSLLFKLECVLDNSFLIETTSSSILEISSLVFLSFCLNSSIVPTFIAKLPSKVTIELSKDSSISFLSLISFSNN